MDDDAQTKDLRLRMYVLCSECAHLIDLARAIGRNEKSKARTLSDTKAKGTRSGWKCSA